MHVIVLVEDEPLIRVAIAERLIEEGFKVWEAEHTEVLSLRAIEEPSVHALFTDVCMPGEMDGDALGHRVRATWPLSKPLE